jgi:protein phosphatase 1G
MQENTCPVCEKLTDNCLAPVSGGDGCDNMAMIVVQLKRPVSSVATSSATQSAAT